MFKKHVNILINHITLFILLTIESKQNAIVYQNVVTGYLSLRYQIFKNVNQIT